MLCAFDLLEVNGEDIRPEPIEDRKRRLAGLLRLPHDGIALNEQFKGDGAMIYKHACALGCEGIVSKRVPHKFENCGAVSKTPTINGDLVFFLAVVLAKPHRSAGDAHLCSPCHCVLCFARPNLLPPRAARRALDDYGPGLQPFG